MYYFGYYFEADVEVQHSAYRVHKNFNKNTVMEKKSIIFNNENELTSIFKNYNS